MPEISVIMSVYNGEDYLAEAIDSVVNQTFKDWELIIINDCSTDGTAEILDKYKALDERIIISPNEVNLKLPSSLNKAIDLARGKYIARMDADDICLPDRLKKQYEFMESNQDIDLSSCRFMTLKNGVVASGGGGGRWDKDAINALLLFTNPILHPGVIGKSEMLKKLKYDTSLTCTEDLEIWTRVARENYKMMIQREYLMLYRLHDKQITETTKNRQYKEVVKIQKEYFDALLEKMSEEQEDFYISGIYFRDKMDIEKFCSYYKWIKKANKKKKAFKEDALDYALFEILAEYKRCGMQKKDILKGMLCFSPFFLMKELRGRKKRAKEDGIKCIKAAEEIGYKHTNGIVEFPVFSK